MKKNKKNKKRNPMYDKKYSRTIRDIRWLPYDEERGERRPPFQSVHSCFELSQNPLGNQGNTGLARICVCIHEEAVDRISRVQTKNRFRCVQARVKTFSFLWVHGDGVFIVAVPSKDKDMLFKYFLVLSSMKENV